MNANLEIIPAEVLQHDSTQHSASNYPVTAIVLSTGEQSTPRAIDSIRALQPALREIIVVRNVKPISRAQNTGIARVSTPWFVIVDADMILDSDAVSRLLAIADQQTAMAYGYLRDKMLGQLPGLNLYRTECFETVAFPDTVSLETDLHAMLEQSGWNTVCLTDTGRAKAFFLPTVGEHAPAYTPHYVYRKFTIEAARYKSRRRPDGLRWHIGCLESSEHVLALLAQIALLRGMFRNIQHDATGDSDESMALSAELQSVMTYLYTDADINFLPLSVESSQLSIGSNYQKFRRSLMSAQRFYKKRDSADFRHVFKVYSVGGYPRNIWVKFGLAYGLVYPDAAGEQIRQDYATLKGFLSDDAEQGLQGRLRSVVRWARIKIPGVINSVKLRAKLLLARLK